MTLTTTALSVKNLYVDVQNKAILNGLNLDLPKGEIHILMGPNGSGKSTFAHTLLGAEHYHVKGGSIVMDGEDIGDFSPDVRAQKGFFLGFQYPVAIPGLKISEYLRSLYNLKHKKPVNVAEFRKILKEKLDLLKIERSSLQRYLNDGFSGGETKRFEMLQLLILEPKLAVLDEIDSGVDIDAQKIVAECIRYATETYQTSFLIVTHYQRLLKFLQPHKIHIMMNGKIVRSGDISLAQELEDGGYAKQENFDAANA